MFFARYVFLNVYYKSHSEAQLIRQSIRAIVRIRKNTVRPTIMAENTDSAASVIDNATRLAKNVPITPARRGLLSLHRQSAASVSRNKSSPVTKAAPVTIPNAAVIIKLIGAVIRAGISPK